MDMERINGEPVVYLDINDENEESGMEAISFVETPATLTKWFKFNDIEEETFFNFEKDEMKRVVTGPVMLAETPIKRIDDNGNFYWVKFSADTIFKMRNKYFKENKIHNINENHNKNLKVDGVYMVESFIIDEKTKTNLYPDLEVGTWMASFYVDDEKYWNETIMNDKFNGFSLEGNFKPTYGEKKKKQKMNKMEILNKIKDLFSSVEFDEHEEKNEKNPDDETKMFVDVKTVDGAIMRVSEMAEGATVVEITEEGEMEVDNGTYTLENGIDIMVENGLISSISVPEEAEEEQSDEPDMLEPELNAVETPGDKPKKIVETHTTSMEFEKIEELIKNSFNEIKNELNELKKENGLLKERVNKFAAEPSVEPTLTKMKLTGVEKQDKLKFFAKR
jgi:hypothetical protein